MADQNNNQQNNQNNQSNQNNQNDQNASGIDNTIDNAINTGIDDASKRVPEGQKIDPAVKQKADQAANNEINQEAQKGLGGMKSDAENLMDKNK
jgi:hypothetical protein